MSVGLLKKINNSAKKRLLLWEEQGKKCAYCDAPIEDSDKGSLDHIYPRWRGGKRWYNNLAFVCLICNQLKGGFACYDEAAEYTARVMSLMDSLARRGIVPYSLPKHKKPPAGFIRHFVAPANVAVFMEEKYKNWNPKFLHIGEEFLRARHTRLPVMYPETDGALEPF
jgi:hypothetical protein